MRGKSGKLLLAGVFQIASSELLQVFVLQRHGSRAPDLAVAKVCPKVAGSVDDIEREFGAKPGMLTPTGMRNMRESGKFFHERYLEGDEPLFKLPANVTPEERARIFHFEATKTSRHIESAKLVAEQLFAGSSPPAVVVDRIYDNFLGLAGDCIKANQNDALDWLKREGDNMYSPRKPCVKEIQQICGYEFTNADMDRSAANPHPPLQDIVDLLEFRSQANLSLPRNVGAVFDEGRYIQYQGIQERLLGTDEQVVYWMGEFPGRLLEAFSSDEKKFSVFVTSREKLYAAEFFFGFLFNAGGVLPEGAIYPGTALIFELHRKPHGKVVRVGYYYPGGHPSLDRPHAAEFKWVTLPGCGGLTHCQLDTFTKNVLERGKVNGKDFLEICAERGADNAAAVSSGHLGENEEGQILYM